MGAAAGAGDQRDAGDERAERAGTGAAGPVYVAVVGSGSEPEPGAGRPDLQAAVEVGRRLAEAGAVVVCGGLGGVMEAACRGAREAGGVTVGILPGADRAAANRFVTVAVATGLGELRNGVVVRSADAVVAIGGEYGTLSEIALALKMGRPVVGLGTFSLRRPDGSADEAVVRADDPAGAVTQALTLAARARSRRSTAEAETPSRRSRH